MSTIIKNGLVVLEEKSLIADLKIVDQKIVEIKENISATENDKVIDAIGKIVLPGVIDAHVHFNLNFGDCYTADDFVSGSKSASYGGTTTYIDFASPIREKTLLESLEKRLAEAGRDSYLDYTVHMEVTGWSSKNYQELKKIKEAGINSIKFYTTYGDTKVSVEQFADLFKTASELDLVLMIHAENDQILSEKKEQLIAQGKTQIKYHAVSRPLEAEVESIKTMINLANQFGTNLYIAHVSTEEGAKLIKEARKSNKKIMGETCPHYFILNDSLIELEDGAKYTMSPPLRKKANNQPLLNILAADGLQCVSTDHCSFDLQTKFAADHFYQLKCGVAGVETLLRTTYTYGVHNNKFDLIKLSNLLSTNPAKIFNLYPRKGVIKVGSDADIVIYDPKPELLLNERDLHSRCGYSIFNGIKLKGVVEYTILRGKILVDQGKFIATKKEGIFIKSQI